MSDFKIEHLLEQMQLVENKVAAVIERRDSLQKDNRELHSRVSELEKSLKQTQKEFDKSVEERLLIRKKIDNLLLKLDTVITDN